MSGLFVLFLQVLWVSLACALVVEKTVTLRSLTDFEQFGFQPGGKISFSGSSLPDQENVTLFICTDKQFDMLSSFPDPNDMGYCTATDMNTCDYTANYNTLVEYQVPSKNRYHLVLVQCGIKELIKVDVKYTLLNPGGEQLPLGEIPLPNLYIVITCVWAILVAVSGFVWMKNRPHVIMLHMLLTAVGILKLAVVIVALIYWHIFRETGRDIIQLKYLQSFIYALSETAFFCSLLLISKGWRITRSNLPPSEIRTISVALVLLLSTLLFFSFYNDGYYFLSLMIMYFFMLPKIFTSITRNTRALHTHILLARYANVELNVAPVHAKIKMFKALRTAVILYLGSILVISSMKIIMWWFLVWVTFCVSELVTIVMLVAVCVLTRPRENGVFSPRSYFEGGPFPILNMQQFDHFDELFGDQIWDPEMVFGNNAAAVAAASGHPHIDVSESIVIEYPVPYTEDGEPSFFPRLAIATLEKKDKDKDKDKDNKDKDGEEDSSDEKGGGLLRRRAPLSRSTLGSSTTALLSPESPSLVSSNSSSPLLISTLDSLPLEGLELDIMVDGEGEEKKERHRSHSLTTTATQTSPHITPSVSPTPFVSTSPSSSSTTTTTTTTTTSSPQPNDRPSTPQTPTFLHKRQLRKTSDKEKDGSDGITVSTSSSSPPPLNCKITIPESPSSSSHSLSPLSSPTFTSSSSLLSKSEKDERWRKGDDGDDELL